MPPANPKPDLLQFFARIDELARQLPSDADPALLHYLQKKSYEKARLICRAATRKTGPATAGMKISRVTRDESRGQIRL